MKSLWNKVSNGVKDIASDAVDGVKDMTDDVMSDMKQKKVDEAIELLKAEYAIHGGVCPCCDRS